MHVQPAAGQPDTERPPASLLDQAFRLAPRDRLRRRIDAIGEIPQALLPGAAGDRDLAAQLKDLEHQPHLARAPPAMRLVVGQQVGLEVPREHRAAPLELAEDVPAEACVRRQEVAHPGVAALRPVTAHPGADERQIVDRPDERVPLEELPLLPDEPVELGDVEPAEPAVQHEVLRRCDRRDRIELQEAEPLDDVQDTGAAPVQQLRAHGDAPRALETRVLRPHRVVLSHIARRI